ncbi:mucin-22 isoform X2 [Armigeres subalbatus]
MRNLDKLWWWRPTPPSLHRISLPKNNCSNTLLLAVLVLLCSSLSVVQTGPVTRSRRMLREIHSENTDTNVQNVTKFFADTCLYDGTQVSRTSITCEKKHGCRAIQKTGECCPDYQCECQRDGKVYSNGEKVFDPETPCRVCYCQGGELSCSQVSCYKRHDCEPKFIPGRCCPEYDNCPPLENSNIAEPTSPVAESSELKETELVTDDLLDAENKKLSSITSNDVTAAGTTTPSTTTVSTEGSTTAKLQIPAASNNPLGIKIKEITKPEEIRLTDSRPKITTTTGSANSLEVVAHPSTESSSATSGHSEEAVNLEHLDLNITDDGEEGMKNVRHTEDELPANGTSEVTDSSESSTAGPSDSSSSSVEIEASSEVNSFSSTTVRISVPSTVSTTTALPDDVSDEVTKKDKPLPAVVQIGDKLVIVDHNQPKPITVIQVEEVAGLQRGEDDISYDQEMYTDRAPETPKHMKLESGEEEMLSTQADSSVAFETVYHGGSTENLASEEVFETQHYTEGPENSAEKNETHSDQLLASSEEFIQLTPSSDKPVRLEEEHTTLNSLATSVEEGSTTLADLGMSSASSEASGDEVYETHFYTEGPVSSSETTEAVGNALGDTSESATAVKETPSDDMAATESKPYIEDDEHDLIQPGFQPIPEDFSLRDQPAMEDDLEPSTASAKSERKEDVGTPKILSEVLEYKHNTSSSTETTSEGDNDVTISPSWLKEESKPMLRAPGEPHLIPEWERSNVTVSNSSLEEEFSGAGEFHVLKMNSEEYIDSSAEGSGGHSIRKEPEETTLAPSKSSLQDIDALESGSSSESDSVKHNPKNDVESVKYDEDENSTVQEVLPKQVKPSV